MSYLRILPSIVVLLSLSSPSWAAVSDDLDARVLLQQTTDHSGRCRKGTNGAEGAESCCGTSFQAMPGSLGSRGSRNLCFGAQSIGALSSGAVSQSGAQALPPLPIAYARGGAGSSGASSVTSFFSSGSGDAEPLSQTLFGGGGGGGGQNLGAPGPVAGAGLPALIVAGAYALVRRRRARA